MAESYFKLLLAALIPVAATILFYELQTHTTFGRWRRAWQQLVIGLVFGGISVLGTEWGIPMNGVLLNCRDAAPLCAGLLFGGPAGILAGLIGGVERWIAVAWGAGTVTRLACSVSTAVAGLYAAALRRVLFDDKRPTWSLCLASGIVMEVFHLTMVFITNLSNPDNAVFIVKSCLSMIAFCGLSVVLSAMTLSILAGETLLHAKTHRITDTIQRELLVCVVAAFVLTSGFVYILQSGLVEKQSANLLHTAISDVAGEFAVSGGNISGIAVNRHIGETGYLVIANERGLIVSHPSGFIARSLMELDLSGTVNENGVFTAIIADVPCLCAIDEVAGYTVLAVYPEQEAAQYQDVAVYVNAFMEVLIFALLFGLIYLLIKRVVLNNLNNINDSLAQISKGNLDVVVDVRPNEEFASLSDDINSTVDTLKRYIAEAAARIDQELEFSQNIQSSALPNVSSPSISERKEFAISAQMNAAKEVGGDFYDFYTTNDNTLNFMIADVSGKGIPAAMFMMRAKTELKSLAESGLAMDEIFTRGNTHLCEGNDADMFVTSWMGQLDLETGLVSFANAGHNPPLVRHQGGTFEYLHSKVGLVLAGMDGMRYKRQELQLQPGDLIFLYTDGVTEATNAKNELYGEERLQKCLNSANTTAPEELCRLVKADVDAFVAEAPQFDDLTMLALRFDGKPKLPEMHFNNASFDDIPVVTEFVEQELEKMDCPMKAQIQISVAIDEIFSNIVKFAYGKSSGPVTVRLKRKENPHGVALYFIDEGIPYNPVKRDDPDIELSAQDRQIGGLGIYMVKKSMDDMSYAYRDGCNILRLFKKF